MLKNKGGFTLIELVMIIVILGILAAVAIPRYVDLREDADKAGTKGVLGGINSAASIAYAAYLTSKSRCDGIPPTTLITTPDLLAQCLDGGTPKEWTIVGGKFRYASPTKGNLDFTFTAETATNKASVRMTADTLDWP